MIALTSRHISLIHKNAAVNAVRGGAGLLFLLATLVFGLIVAAIILMPIESMPRRPGVSAEESRRVAIKEVARLAHGVVSWAIGGSFGATAPIDPAEFGDQPPPPAPKPTLEQERVDRWANFLLKDRPAILSFVFLIMLFGLPLLIPLLGFNQYSSDVQSRGLRYLLLRTERANIFFGRFLGTVTFGIIVVAVVVLVVTLYLALKIRVYGAGEVFWWGLCGFLAMSILLLPYIAFCSLVSATIDSPFLSLTVSSVVIGGVPLAALIAGSRWEYGKYLKFALPWGYQTHLLHPDLTHWLGAAGLCLVYTAVFLALGCWRFETRDL